jgi:xanthine/uracil permease
VAHRERETSGAGASALTRPWLARTPWWLLLVLGVGAVAIGLALCLDANAPLPEIFLLIALGFLVCGLDDLLILDEPRPRPVPVIIGVSFIVFGVLAAAWGPRYPVVLAYAIAGVLGIVIVAILAVAYARSARPSRSSSSSSP